MKGFVLGTFLFTGLLLVALDVASSRWPAVFSAVRVILVLELAGLLALAHGIGCAWAAGGKREVGRVLPGRWRS